MHKCILVLLFIELVWGNSDIDLRKKVTQLEKSIDSLKQTIVSLKIDMANVKKENKNFFSQIKKININNRSDNSEKDVFESKIDGEFEGWDGETIVKLMNGQIWQQIEYYYTYSYSFMPNVLVYKTGRNYKMKVDGIDKIIEVIRLK
jgi:hypothetical protein